MILTDHQAAQQTQGELTVENLIVKGAPAWMDPSLRSSSFATAVLGEATASTSVRRRAVQSACRWRVGASKRMPLYTCSSLGPSIVGVSVSSCVVSVDAGQDERRAV